jgi:hypothetical protein
MSAPIPRLITDAAAFRKGIKTLSAVVKKPGDAVIRFADGLLVVEVSGTEAELKAEGEWPGRARVNGTWLLGAWRTLPESGPLALGYDDFLLSIGAIRVKAIWQDIAPATFIELPVNATPTDLLCAWVAFSEAEITSCGLAARIESALEARRRAEMRALDALECMGVRAEDIEEIVDRGLRRVMPEAWRSRR